MQIDYSKFLSLCHFCKSCHVSCHINWFKTSNWYCILTHIFFWLNTEYNANPYTIKPPRLSSIRECDYEPQGTIFSWFGAILFLPHQNNIIDHRWPLAMDHICKNKEPCVYVHKKTSRKLSRPSNPSLDEKVYLSYLYFTHYLVQVSLTQIQQYLSRLTISADFSVYINRFLLPKTQELRS